MPDQRGLEATLMTIVERQRLPNHSERRRAAYPRTQTSRPGTQEEFIDYYDGLMAAYYEVSGGTLALVQSIEEAVSVRLDKADNMLLDCAAGTGLPALDLITRGRLQTTIHCTDADQSMLRRLESKTIQVGTMAIGDLAPTYKDGRSLDSIDTLTLNWAQLGLLSDKKFDQYDYIMCRGNSLAYTDTWGGGTRVATKNKIRANLQQMMAKLKPGGWLHVDAPRQLQLCEVQRPSVAVDDRPCSFWEKVEAIGDARVWRMAFKFKDNHHDVPSETVTFERYSSQLVIDDLRQMLKDLGMSHTDVLTLDGERANFGVIIAQKS